MKLAGKVAIVTGSSRGIGRAISLAFAKEGANVVVNILVNNAADFSVMDFFAQQSRLERLGPNDCGEPKGHAKMFTSGCETHA